MPNFIVGDDAFALRTWMMKPYSKRHLSDPERIFNYRLSRARRIVENAFGILVQSVPASGLSAGTQVPVPAEKPEAEIKTVASIVLACVCLHNMIILRNPRQQNVEVDHEDEDHNIIPGIWSNDLVRLLPVRGQFRKGIDTEVAKNQGLLLDVCHGKWTKY